MSGGFYQSVGFHNSERAIVVQEAAATLMLRFAALSSDIRLYESCSTSLRPSPRMTPFVLLYPNIRGS